MSCKKISQDESDVSLYELNNTLTLFYQDGEIGVAKCTPNYAYQTSILSLA